MLDWDKIRDDLKLFGFALLCAATVLAVWRFT